jgi:hypothetical protein
MASWPATSQLSRHQPAGFWREMLAWRGCGGIWRLFLF